MLSVVMLNVIMISVIMLNVIMISVVKLNVIMISVIMLNVVAPSRGLYYKTLHICNVWIPKLVRLSANSGSD
jgi:hypothetical protein